MKFAQNISLVTPSIPFGKSLSPLVPLKEGQCFLISFVAESNC